MNRQFQTFAFSIQNASNESVDINIDGDIVDAQTQQILKDWFGDDSSVSFKSFRKQLEAVEAKVYNVYINSGGGLVTDAMAIHDLLVDMQAKGKTVNTIGRGIIASAATYILMAGKTPEMSKNSWFMIHNVSGGVWGDVNMVESYAATLRKFNNASRDFYANATGKRKEDITKMMDAETWMTAEEALNHGFIKQVSGESNFTNSIKKEHWPFANTAVLNAYNSAVKPAIQQPQNFTDEMKKFFTDLGAQIMNAIKGIKAPENNDHAALMTSIGEVLNNSFQAASEKMETEVNKQSLDAVLNALKDTKDNDVKTFVVNLIANDLKKKVDAYHEKEGKALSQKIKDLETEITNMKGNSHKPGNEGGGVEKTVGSFS